MALIFYDGFDNYQVVGLGAGVNGSRSNLFQWSDSIANIVSPGRNNYGSAIQMSSLLGTLTTPLTTAYFGFGGKMQLNGAGTVTLIDLHSGPGQTLVQMGIRFNTSANSVEVWNGNPTGGGTLLGSTPNNVYTTGTWNYFEFAVTIGNTGGAVQVRINGQIVLNLTGIDTQLSSNATFDGLSFVNFTLDDFYIADTATGPGGIPFNSFAGDVRVVALHPIGAGASTAWTPLALTNWQEVAEVQCDGDVSYNSTNTVGAKDLFNFQALSGTISVILGVQVVGVYRKDDAASHTIAQHLVSGGTDTLGPNYTVPSDIYIYCTDLYPVDPNTGTTWTVPGVNALQAGYVLTA